ncbi:MAG: DNA-protecting protein DprA [Actinobacteria bacterium]|nr:DNA-protecting protein DprA [Actinomycetota bacterium]
MSAPWGDIAAPGTDPAVLERLVATIARRGGTSPLVKHAVELAITEGSLDPDDLLDRIAPPTTLTERQSIIPVVRLWRQLGVRAAAVGDPAYPWRLARGWPESGAPPLLAWRGPAAGIPDVPAVAIVGARRATGYGTAIAAWIAESAGRAGVLVVSGGAVGIDAAAHRAALGTSGATAVVLGCGHDVRYPRPHATVGGLFDQALEAGGALVSEYLPGVEPKPHNVVARNRVVAGMVDAVVVVEGSDRSGSLRTAAAAAALDVPVLAVPGDVRAPGSAAPHRLLAEGAAPCTGPSDVLDALGRSEVDHDRPAQTPSPLPEPVHAELARRWPRAVAVDELAAITGTPAGQLLAALTRARVAGFIAESAEGVRLSRAPR